MRRVKEQSILDAIPKRAEGYFERVKELSEYRDGYYFFTPENYLQIVKEFSPHHYASELVKMGMMPKPVDLWPPAIQLVKKLKRKGDKGIGDTIARLIPNGEKFKQWFKEMFGQDCGCSDRQEWLNRRFPY